MVESRSPKPLVACSSRVSPAMPLRASACGGFYFHHLPICHVFFLSSRNSASLAAGTIILPVAQLERSNPFCHLVTVIHLEASAPLIILFKSACATAVCVLRSHPPLSWRFSFLDCLYLSKGYTYGAKPRNEFREISGP